jgi:hypothetical protein
MIQMQMLKGKKSDDDVIIRIWANGEIITLEDILKMLDVIFKSEDSNYPIEIGFEGRAYFLKAIVDLACGIPLERVLKNYRLKRKVSRQIDRLHQILE